MLAISLKESRGDSQIKFKLHLVGNKSEARKLFFSDNNTHESLILVTGGPFLGDSFIFNLSLFPGVKGPSLTPHHNFRERI